MCLGGNGNWLSRISETRNRPAIAYFTPFVIIYYSLGLSFYNVDNYKEDYGCSCFCLHCIPHFFSFLVVYANHFETSGFNTVYNHSDRANETSDETNI